MGWVGGGCSGAVFGVDGISGSRSGTASVGGTERHDN